MGSTNPDQSFIASPTILTVCPPIWLLCRLTNREVSPTTHLAAAQTNLDSSGRLSPASPSWSDPRELTCIMQYLGRLSELMGSLLLTGLMERIVKSCVPTKLGQACSAPAELVKVSVVHSQTSPSEPRPVRGFGRHVPKSVSTAPRVLPWTVECLRLRSNSRLSHRLVH